MLQAAAYGAKGSCLSGYVEDSSTGYRAFISGEITSGSFSEYQTVKGVEGSLLDSGFVHG